jgi:hypothetical protein
LAEKGDRPVGRMPRRENVGALVLILWPDKTPWRPGAGQVLAWLLCCFSRYSITSLKDAGS